MILKMLGRKLRVYEEEIQGMFKYYISTFLRTQSHPLTYRVTHNALATQQCAIHQLLRNLGFKSWTFSESQDNSDFKATIRLFDDNLPQLCCNIYLFDQSTYQTYGIVNILMKPNRNNINVTILVPPKKMCIAFNTAKYHTSWVFKMLTVPGKGSDPRILFNPTKFYWRVSFDQRKFYEKLLIMWTRFTRLWRK